MKPSEQSISRYCALILAFLLLAACEQESAPDSAPNKADELAMEAATPTASEQVEPARKPDLALEPAPKFDRGDEIAAAESVIAAEDQARVTAEDVRKATLEAIEAARKYAIQREVELHREVDLQYADFQRRLEEMKQRAEKLRATAKDKISKELTVLDEQAKSSGIELAELEKRSAETVARLNKRLDQLLSQMTGIEERKLEPADSEPEQTVN